jgi:hypothetical protein
VVRTIIQLAVDDRVFETLMMFDAEAADLEPESDDEEDGSPVLIELVRPKARRADPDGFQRRGGRKRIVAPDGSELAPTPSRSLTARWKALARAWRWQGRVVSV